MAMVILFFTSSFPGPESTSPWSAKHFLQYPNGFLVPQLDFFLHEHRSLNATYRFAISGSCIGIPPRSLDIYAASTTRMVPIAFSTRLGSSGTAPST